LRSGQPTACNECDREADLLGRQLLAVNEASVGAAEGQFKTTKQPFDWTAASGLRRNIPDASECAAMRILAVPG
jgi:hypothetical protein